MRGDEKCSYHTVARPFDNGMVIRRFPGVGYELNGVRINYCPHCGEQLQPTENVEPSGFDGETDL